MRGMVEGAAPSFPSVRERCFWPIPAFRTWPPALALTSQVEFILGPVNGRTRGPDSSPASGERLSGAELSQPRQQHPPII